MAVSTKAKVEEVKSADVPDEAVKQDKPEVAEDENREPQYYVHLANGQVLRVNESDLPTRSGSNAHFGHWQTRNKVFQVIGIYPVEDVVKDDK